MKTFAYDFTCYQSLEKNLVCICPSVCIFVCLSAQVALLTMSIYFSLLTLWTPNCHIWSVLPSFAFVLYRCDFSWSWFCGELSAKMCCQDALTLAHPPLYREILYNWIQRIIVRNREGIYIWFFLNCKIFLKGGNFSECVYHTHLVVNSMYGVFSFLKSIQRKPVAAKAIFHHMEKLLKKVRVNWVRNEQSIGILLSYSE